MMRVKTMLFAENVIRDAETTRISVVNIFERISAQGFPYLFPILSVLIISERTEEDESKYDCRLVLKLDRQELLRTELPIDFQKGFSNRATFRIIGFVLPTYGKLEATLFLGKKILGRCDIRVDLVARPRIEKKSTAENRHSPTQ